MKPQKDARDDGGVIHLAHIKEKLKNRFICSKNVFFDISVILAISLLSITWFRGDYLINGGDFGLIIDRFKYFHLTQYIWDDTISTGYPAPVQHAGLFIYGLYGAFTEFLGLSIEFFEKSFFYIWFASSGISMYYLTYVLGVKRVGRLATSLFYMMNPISLAIMWKVSIGFFPPPYAYAPLILGIYIHGLEKQKDIKFIFASLIFYSLISNYSYLWPVVVGLHWTPIALYFIFYLFVHKDTKKRKSAIKYSSYFICIWILLNALWLGPMLYTFSDQISSATHRSDLGYISDYDTFKLNSVSLLGGLRLMGLWSIGGEYLGDPFYAWADTFSTIPFILITFLIPIFAFLPFFSTDRKIKQNATFFSALALAALFFGKGPFPPLEILNTTLYKNMPGVALVFRMGFIAFSFILAVAYSVLVGLGVFVFYEFLVNKAERRIAVGALGVIFILLFGVLAYPFWTGDVIQPRGKYMPGERIKVPEYYYGMKDWIGQEDGNFRIFSLPSSKNYNAIYSWEDTGETMGYAGADIIRWFSSKPVIYANFGPLYPVIGKEIEGQYYNGDTFAKVLGLLGVKYILLHKDFNYYAVKDHPWWYKQDLRSLETFLSSQKEVKHASTIGKLDFYAIDGSYFHDLIYGTSDLTYLEGDISGIGFVNIPSFNEFTFFASNLTSIEQSQEERLKEISNNVIISKTIKSEEPNTVSVPISGVYTARLILNDSTPVLYGFDTEPLVKVNKFSNCSKDYCIMELKESMLSQGDHTFNIKNINGTGYLILQSTKEGELSVDIRYKKVNPIKYEVTINTTQPYILVFGESFNSKWRVYEGDIGWLDPLYKKEISNYHLLANGYANGWHIGKTGNYTITLFFWPQLVYYACLMVSGLTLLIGVVIIIRDI